MVDTWHLLKGSTDPQAGLRLLEEIPSRWVTGLQLADALVTSQAPTLYGEGRYRRFPGEGELPLDSVIRLLLAGDGLQSVGPEVFGAAIDELGTVTAGVRAAQTTRDALHAAEAKKLTDASGRVTTQSPAHLALISACWRPSVAATRRWRRARKAARRGRRVRRVAIGPVGPRSACSAAVGRTTRRRIDGPRIVGRRVLAYAKADTRARPVVPPPGVS